MAAIGRGAQSFRVKRCGRPGAREIGKLSRNLEASLALPASLALDTIEPIRTRRGEARDRRGAPKIPRLGWRGSRSFGLGSAAARSAASRGFSSLAALPKSIREARLGAEHAVSPFGDVEVDLENAALRPEAVERHCHRNFQPFANEGTGVPQEEVLHRLHGEGRGASARPAFLILVDGDMQSPPSRRRDGCKTVHPPKSRPRRRDCGRRRRAHPAAIDRMSREPAAEHQHRGGMGLRIDEREGEKEKPKPSGTR